MTWFFSNSSCSADHASNVGQDAVCSVFKASALPDPPAWLLASSLGPFHPGLPAGWQPPNGVKASSLLLPLCWARLPLDWQPTAIRGALCPLARVSARHLISTKYHPGQTLPCGNHCGSQSDEGEYTNKDSCEEAKPVLCKQGALIYMCADRWSDLKYSLQIPLSPRKGAGS